MYSIENLHEDEPIDYKKGIGVYMNKNLVCCLFIILFFSGCKPMLSEDVADTEVDIMTEMITEEETRDLMVIEGKIDRSSISNRSFDTYDICNEIFELKIDQNIITEPDYALDLAMQLLIDYNDIEELIGQSYKSNMIIIVTDKHLMTGADIDMTYFNGNMIITSLEFIESGEFLGVLTSVAYNIDVPWLYFGIADQINRINQSSDEVGELLLSEEYIQCLDFFAPRFYGEVNGIQKNQMRLLAGNFIQYTIESNRLGELIEFYRNDNYEEIKLVMESWLNIYEIQLLDLMIDSTISFGDEYYDMVIKSSQADYYVKLNENYIFESYDRVVYLLQKNNQGILLVKDLLNSSEVSNEYVEYNTRPIYYIDESQNQIIAADAEKNIIYYTNNFATFEYSHIHEYVHTIVPFDILKLRLHEYTYFGEGIACYLTSVVDNEFSINSTDFNTMKSINYYIESTKDVFSHDFSTVSESFQFYITKFKDYYECYSEDIIDFSDCDPQIYHDAYSYAVLETINEFESFDDFDGFSSSLEYDMYESFIWFLVDNYGLERVISCLAEFDDLENILGKSYDLLRGDWIDYLYRDIY